MFTVGTRTYTYLFTRRRIAGAIPSMVGFEGHSREVAKIARGERAARRPPPRVERADAGVEASMVGGRRFVVEAPAPSGRPSGLHEILVRFPRSRARARGHGDAGEYLSVGARAGISRGGERGLAARADRIALEVARGTRLPRTPCMAAPGLRDARPSSRSRWSRTVFGQSSRPAVRGSGPDGPLTRDLLPRADADGPGDRLPGWTGGVEGRRWSRSRSNANRRPPSCATRAGGASATCGFGVRRSAGGWSRTAEVTAVADGFCPPYELSFEAQAGVKRYIRGLRLTLAKLSLRAGRRARGRLAARRRALDWPRTRTCPAGRRARARSGRVQGCSRGGRRRWAVDAPRARRAGRRRATTRAPSVSCDHRRSRHSSAQCPAAAVVRGSTTRRGSPPRGAGGVDLSRCGGIGRVRLLASVLRGRASEARRGRNSPCRSCPTRAAAGPPAPSLALRRPQAPQTEKELKRAADVDRGRADGACSAPGARGAGTSNWYAATRFSSSSSAASAWAAARGRALAPAAPAFVPGSSAAPRQVFSRTSPVSRRARRRASGRDAHLRARKRPPGGITRRDAVGTVGGHPSGFLGDPDDPSMGHIVFSR